jgi:pimeloyl-ACP methyl ester carboxylesterase
MQTHRLLLKFFFLLGFACLALFLDACRPTGSSYTPVFTEQPCPVDLPAGYFVRCGTVSVPEDRQVANGRQVKLSIAVAQPPGGKTEAPPVIMLTGGPGGVAIEGLPFLLEIFDKVIAQRPVIFFDQRGVGFSEPPLDCPELEVAQLETLTRKLSAEGDDQIIARAYEKCKTRLEQDGVSLRAYTTAASADDVRDIVVSLGYPKVYLFGGSYGTRLAQVTLLRHQSEGWISGAILDSVVPLQVDEEKEFWSNTQAVFKQLFELCSRDSKCAARYPDLQRTFGETMEQLKSDPLEVNIFHPETGESVRIILDERDFYDVLFMMLYDPFEASKIPQLIDRIHEGDTGMIREPLRNHLRGGHGIYEAMYTSVSCTDEGLKLDLYAIREANAVLDPVFQELAEESGEKLQSLCQSWGVRPADPAENRALRTDLPVLILAGERDPITPAVWGRLLHTSIPGSYYYEFPGTSHSVFSQSYVSYACAESIILAFLNDSSGPPDGGCLSNIKPLPFRVPSN